MSGTPGVCVTEHLAQSQAGSGGVSALDSPISQWRIATLGNRQLRVFTVRNTQEENKEADGVLQLVRGVLTKVGLKKKKDLIT